MSDETPVTEGTAATIAICRELVDERIKQRCKWGNAHDDGHRPGDLAMNGSTYAMASSVALSVGERSAEFYSTPVLDQFPIGVWAPEPTNRATLVKAAALIVAEIERIDRKHNANIPNPPKRTNHTPNHNPETPT